MVLRTLVEKGGLFCVFSLLDCSRAHVGHTGTCFRELPNSGADVVAAAYKQAEDGEAKILMNRVNLLEVYYGFYREDGKEFAEFESLVGS